VFGILLRVGVLPGPSPLALTIIPAAVAGAMILVFLLIALIPEDMERRMERFTQGYRFKKLAQRLATAPVTLASGTRTAIAFVREPQRGAGQRKCRAVGFRRGHPAAHQPHHGRAAG